MMAALCKMGVVASPDAVPLRPEFPRGLGIGAEPLRFVVSGGRRYPKALLEVPSLVVISVQVKLKEKEKEKERGFFLIVRSQKMLVKCFNTFECLSKDGENDTEFSLPGFSSRVPVLKTPFSEPEWQDPEFFKEGSRIGGHASCT